MSPSEPMTLAHVRALLKCTVLVDSGALESTHVEQVSAADLMSDVLAFVQPGALLLTGLTNPQSVRTAIVSDVTAVVYVRNKMPDAECIALAKTHRLPLLQTPLTLYEACGRLYAAGLAGAPGSVAAKRGEDELHPTV